RSTNTPLGPSAPFCASTALPRLIAARSLPVGAISFTTSGAAAPCAQAAKAPDTTNSSEQATFDTIREMAICDMVFLPADQRPASLNSRRLNTTASIRRRCHTGLLFRARNRIGDEA